jgi:hypothetical protein
MRNLAQLEQLSLQRLKIGRTLLASLNAKANGPPKFLAAHL